MKKAAHSGIEETCRSMIATWVVRGHQSGQSEELLFHLVVLRAQLLDVIMELATYTAERAPLEADVEWEGSMDVREYGGSRAEGLLISRYV